jgi:hypothetical protein
MVLGLAPQPGHPLTRVVSSGLAHTAGLVVGGGAVGLVLGFAGALAVGWLPRVIALTIVGAIAIGYGLAEVLPLRLPRINPHGQVPRAWIGRRSGAQVYFAFGLLLGAGIFTAAPFASFSGLLMLEFGLGSPWAGGMIGAAYGASRALATVVGQISLTRFENEFFYVKATAARTRLWHPVVGAGCAAVGALCVWVAVA